MNKEKLNAMTDHIYTSCLKYIQHDGETCEECLFNLTAAWSIAILSLVNETFNDDERVSRFLSSVESYCEMEAHDLVSTAIN